MTYDGPPYFPDDTVPPCEICDQDVDACTCPVCKICKVQGRAECIVEHNLYDEPDGGWEIWTLMEHRRRNPIYRLNLKGPWPDA